LSGLRQAEGLPLPWLAIATGPADQRLTQKARYRDVDSAI
jgi:hypothetical protein